MPKTHHNTLRGEMHGVERQTSPGKIAISSGSSCIARYAPFWRFCTNTFPILFVVLGRRRWASVLRQALHYKRLFMTIILTRSAARARWRGSLLSRERGCAAAVSKVPISCRPASATSPST
ncbi:MAG: hypothetical protein ACI8Y8_004006 [Planctomycetota bacterium]|jgi:hypothetical protein